MASSAAPVSTLVSSTILAPTSHPPAAPSAKAIPPLNFRLETDNYLLWKARLKPILMDHRLWCYVDGSSPAPPQHTTSTADGKSVLDPNPNFDSWLVHDQMALGWLFNSVSDGMMVHVVGLSHARDIWLEFEALFATQCGARYNVLRSIPVSRARRFLYLRRTLPVPNKLLTTSPKLIIWCLFSISINKFLLGLAPTLMGCAPRSLPLALPLLLLSCTVYFCSMNHSNNFRLHACPYLVAPCLLQMLPMLLRVVPHSHALLMHATTMTRLLMATIRLSHFLPMVFSCHLPLATLVTDKIKAVGVLLNVNFAISLAMVR